MKSALKSQGSKSLRRSRDRNCALERGDTLPARWYVEPEVYQAEKERIFHRTWQYVGHTGQLNSAGDFFTTHLGDIPVVVLLDTEKEIRAFANVCRHRGSEVVLECSGNRKTLQCHYHGWTYNLNGTLRTAPRENEQRAFAKETLSLAPFAVETWGPLIFVNPSPAARPLRDVLGELPAIFERAGIDFAQMRMLRRDVYEIASNWKVVVENFNECYHCPIAHPKFSEVIDTNAYRVETDSRIFLDLLRTDRGIARQRRDVRDAVAQRIVLALRQPAEPAGDIYHSDRRRTCSASGRLLFQRRSERGADS